MIDLVVLRRHFHDAMERGAIVDAVDVASGDGTQEKCNGTPHGSNLHGEHPHGDVVCLKHLYSTSRDRKQKSQFPMRWS